MFHGVPPILLMLPAFAIVMITMIQMGAKPVVKDRARRRPTHTASLDERSWFDESLQATFRAERDSKNKSRVA